MENHSALPFLREALLFLCLAGILIPLLARLRVNQVLGFIAAGVLFGPSGLRLLAHDFPWLSHATFSAGEVGALGELGVLFLMFMVGLELSAQRIWALRNWVFGAGIAQVLLSALVIGGGAMLLGVRIEVAAVLGLALALSSTAVVMQLLTERRAVALPLGQAGFSILMLQDLAVVPLFILIGVLANGQSVNLGPLLLLTLLKSVLAVAVIYWLGRKVLRPLFQRLAGPQHPDVFVALILLSVLGVGALSEAAGLSMALGAFLAGLLLAETEFRHEVEVTIEPFKGLLMGLFFMSVGMQMNLQLLLESPGRVSLAVAALYAMKAAIVCVLLRAGRFSWGKAAEGGLLLGQGGEFGFVIVGAALAAGLMEPAVGQFTMLVIGVSLFITPAAAKAGRWIGDWWERHRQPEADTSSDQPPPAAGHVVIAGFGRVGNLLGRILASQDIAYVALESNRQLAGRLYAAGLPVYSGDASRADLLHKLNASSAAAIVLTMDHPAAALHAVKAIRRECPTVPLFARSRDEKHALDLKSAGATLVFPETLESGLQLSSQVLKTMGLAENAVLSVVHSERERSIRDLNRGPDRGEEN
jgi:CPA2 family monovalent cation:H+ antiporter-2